MKKIRIVLSLIILASCAKDASNFTLKGHIKDLKKGTVYLQRVKDSALVTIDSLNINGNSEFEFHTNLETPEVLYLKLNKQDNDEGLISFFSDKGITEINSTLKNFYSDAKIKGSKQQEVLEEYQLMMAKFNNKNLDLIKSHLEAQKENDTSKINANLNEYNSLLKRKYLYTVNFAINHKDSDVAPYLALTEIYDANIKFLDTINNSLTPEVKTSKYGKALEMYLENRKKLTDTLH
ncbi:MAG: DUF4369 domain-containing protein [Gelidibacter sp.]|nr:DUF4369 domain-containing protein [Gelidibacter sp.]